jgi:hypothetical protein
MCMYVYVRVYKDSGEASCVARDHKVHGCVYVHVCICMYMNACFQIHIIGAGMWMYMCACIKIVVKRAVFHEKITMCMCVYMYVCI